MRQTLLNFRAPDERTAEFRNISKTKDGINLNYTKQEK